MTNKRAEDPEDFEAKDRRKFVAPRWVWSIPFFITIAGWIYTAGGLQQKVNAQEPINRVIFEKLSKTSDMVITHAAIIPQVEKRMDKMDDKLDRILIKLDK